MMFSMAKRKYKVDNDPVKPLEIISQSAAEIGKPLSVSFRIEVGSISGTTILSLISSPMGGYTTNAVAHLPVKSNGLDQVVIINMECSRYPGPSQ